MKYILTVFLSLVVVFLILSMELKRNVVHVYEMEDDRVDTLYQNDSMFSVVSYQNGKIESINLKQYVNRSHKNAFEIQTLEFGSDGHIAFFRAITGTRISDDSEYIHEVQVISFDENNHPLDYVLSRNFKAICAGGCYSWINIDKK